MPERYKLSKDFHDNLIVVEEQASGKAWIASVSTPESGNLIVNALNAYARKSPPEENKIPLAAPAGVDTEISLYGKNEGSPFCRCFLPFAPAVNSNLEIGGKDYVVVFVELVMRPSLPPLLKIAALPF